MLDSLSPARRRLVLVAGAGALAVLVAVATVLVVRTTGGGVAPVAQDEPGPVLLVSGYGGSTTVLTPLRDVLVAAGRDVVVVPPVGDGTGDIDAQAAALDDQASGAMKRFGAGSVDVVGYSAGGVVARVWVRRHDGASTARRVLSIGSPQHGTALADLAQGIGAGCPLACRQLEPGSDLLRELNARDETPAGPVFVSVWSDTDGVVVPADSARLSGALDFTVQSVCPRSRTTHGGLPGDPVVQAALGTVLGAGAPAAPTGTGC